MYIELFKISLSNLSDSSLTVKFGTVEKIIFKNSYFFQSILDEYCLNYKAYLSLYKLDKKKLLSLLNQKKDISVWYCKKTNDLLINDNYPPSIIQYLNSNWDDVSNISFNPSLRFQSDNKVFNILPFSNYISVYTLFEDKFTITDIKVDEIPSIKDWDSKSKLLDPSSTSEYMFNKMTEFNFTIYDLIKFKDLIRNFTDIVYAICKSLNVPDISEIKGDYKNIVINEPISILFNNFKTKDITDELVDFFSYYYDGAYKSYRSNYIKTINILI